MTACLGTTPPAGRSTDAWRVLTGPAFYTGDAAAPWARAIVVDRLQRVVAIIGRDDLATALPPGIDAIVLPGALATAGLVDAHVHLHWLGQVAETADLRGASSLEEVSARVAEAARASPELPIVRGYGWDEAALGGSIHRNALAADVGDRRPVVLTRVDGHALWLNDAAIAILEAAGLLGDSADGSTQAIMRDDAGVPTGLIVDPALATWNALADPIERERTVGRFDRALRAIQAVGLAAVHDMATRVEHLAALAAAQQNFGAGAPRITVYLEDTEASWDFFEQHAPGPVVLSPTLEIRGLKLFADGALGSRGAALHEPYSDAPDESGSLLPQDVLDERVARAVRLGFDVAIHAIGDRAVDASLKAFEAARRIAGPRPAAEHRHRVEHAQIATAADRARFSALGIIASMQPTHGVSDGPWACSRIGPERGRDAYAIKDFQQGGVHLAFGSDAPIEAFDPLVTLRSAILPSDGPGPCSWLKTQKLDVAGAIDTMTSGASFAAGREAAWGRIAIGMTLELTLFDVNIFDQPARLTDARVVGRVTPGADGPSVAPVGEGAAAKP